jgi:hypothetical protein
MKIKLTTNIGSIDQKRLGLEGKCLDGQTIEAPDKAADELIARGCAIAVPESAKPAAPKPAPAADK